MLFHFHHCWLLIFALTTLPSMEAIQTTKPPHITKTKTFLSPPFTAKPGSVTEKFYYNIDFPTSHIAVKSFHAEVVDDAGNPVSLFDSYLHHWTLVRYFQHKTAAHPDTNFPFTKLKKPNFIIAGNNGICQNNIAPYFYAMGTESRNTTNYLPEPYGIEVGNVGEVPLGYEEKWCLNVHVIDTRGVEDKLGCLECHCHLYNVTKDVNGMPLGQDYKGGLKCCYDGTKCKLLRGNYEGDDQERNLYVRYTVEWVDWDDHDIIPVKVYVFDATDSWEPLTDGSSAGLAQQQHHCHVEYNIESCSQLTNKKLKNNNGEKCKATKSSKVMFPDNGFLVYGLAHQHIGGLGATLYGQDGRVLCSSSPIYGEGNEVGNEKGYVIGMRSCYPKLGNVKIKKGEIGSVVSNYDSTKDHIGVMGLFLIVVADKLPNSSLYYMEA